ncbi:MAG: phosphoribosylamine--glycine ligase, partial [Marivirga sp.]
MNILILGSGGREHALTLKIGQSKLCDKLFVAPGNAGTATIAENVAVDISDHSAVGAFCVDNEVEMLIVGPEAPLVAGITNYFEGKDNLKHIHVVGPSKEGAALEGSKDFSKAFMQRHQIPTAAYATFTKDTLDDGLSYLRKLEAPYVLKADGLAGGKGVLICETLALAEQGLTEMLQDEKFGAASEKVVIEEFLKGIELSVFVLTDGKNYKVLPEAKDYKRIGEGDSGLNTGGMGAISPVIFADKAFMHKVEQKIIQPTVKGIAQEDLKYNGFIFIGLMNVGGEPYVIEYNVRMGDPETQVVLPRIKSDLVPLFKALKNKELDKYSME